MKRPPGPYALFPNGALVASLDLAVVPDPPVPPPEVPPLVVVVDDVLVVVLVLVDDVLVVVVVLVGAVVVEVGERMLVTVSHNPVTGSMRAHEGESEIWARETSLPLESRKSVVTSAKLAPTER